QKGSGILIDSDGWILDTFTHPPMRLFGRQDLLLIAAFTTELVIVFSSSISSALDYAREIERQSGLTLLPALVILTGAFFFHQYRRNHEQQAKAEAAMLAAKEAEHRAEELERLLPFLHARWRPLVFHL